MDEDGDDFSDVLKAHRDSIEQFLSTNFSGQQGVGSIKEITTNPFSLPGTPMYNRFVAQWEQVSDQTVELCFHGTGEANVDAICQSGLDPSRRSGQVYGPGEYFATHAATSLAYCRGGKKMIVFAVLVDKSGVRTTIFCLPSKDLVFF